MNDLAKQITGLSPEKRQLLDRYLKNVGLDLKSAVIMSQPRDRNTFPMSFAQERLWFLDQLEPNQPIYNVPDTHHFKGPLDRNALERALSEIVRRHESMRTTFQMVNGTAMQVIAPPPASWAPEFVDISTTPAEKLHEEAQRLANEEAQTPFNLERGPLFRARLLRLSETEHVLLLTMHHIISDGWSMGVIGRELEALYQAFSKGESSPLAELSIQYADFAVWQREWLKGEVLEKQLSYWREQLGGELPDLELPTDRPRPARQNYRGAALGIETNNTVRQRLKEIARESGTTFFMTALAAFKVLLWRYSGQRDISVGTPIANRNRVETEGLIGFFVNTLVLRTNVDGSKSFRDLLEEVRETTLAAYEHQDVPFEKLVEELQPERSLSRHPLFQVLFTLQDTAGLKLPGVEWSWIDAEIDIAKFDLSLFVCEIETGLYCWSIGQPSRACSRTFKRCWKRSSPTRMRSFQSCAC
jgi:condensation domain-containing protein